MSNALAIVASAAEYLAAAQSLATQLQISCLDCRDPVEIDEFSYVLQLDERLQLRATGRKAPGPVAVDFVGGALAHRRKYGGGKGQQIAKAVGVRGGFYPRVVDATAGLGRDAFVLASLGCHVLMLERNPVVRLLLSDGLRRLRLAAQEDRELAAIATRLELCEEDISAVEWLAQQSPESVQVVYLDPMFPERGKSAKVKKEMAAFHQLVGSDEDADGLLAPAFSACYYRTVVKRPRLAPFLADKKPTLSLEGKSGRFDIYTKHGVP
ncbi:class I SAM-dependent methyltransferase [Microbulbifer marinus]|uniref:Ribosomal RNA small subunit methyltransferase J n=1 Tax=Microbulbifer marinus TaxID=658218 RepID=A0A1H3WA97_9GAMM|nr:class I SAM-dependent methyltransferase [Microbulbifer marinus]SDZ84017.1 16S rRNA (guanine1516-N2)-methyltransferase [Microbulbifer marinus]